MNIHELPRSVRDKLDPRNPRFNHQALADYNQDVVREARRSMITKDQERKERVRNNAVNSDRHQAAMRCLDLKLKGRYENKYRLRDMIRAELGE